MGLYLQQRFANIIHGFLHSILHSNQDQTYCMICSQVRIEGCDRYCFSSSKATTHSSVHSKFFHLWRSWKNSRHRSADLEMNLFKVAIVLISFCTSFGFRGGCKYLIALMWSGLTSIPWCVIMLPKNFPELTPKDHLDEFRCNLCILSTENTFFKSPKCFPRSPCFLPQYHQYMPQHSFRSVLWTFMSPFFNT